MTLNWRKFNEEKPEGGQACLTKMKHGIIEGTYNIVEDCFEGYYWNDLMWSAYYWVPIEEV